MRKMLKRLTSGIMSTVMVASLLAVAPATKVKAEEANYDWEATSLVENGDFETLFTSGDYKGWEILLDTWDDFALWYDTGTSDDNKTTILKVGNNSTSKSVNNISFKQTIAASDIEAGTYKLAFDQMGEAKTSGLSVNLGTASLKLTEPKGWNNWETLYTDEVQLDGNSDVEISISGNLSENCYVYFDNFKLLKKKEDNETITTWEYAETDLIKNSSFEDVFNPETDWTEIDANEIMGATVDQYFNVHSSTEKFIKIQNTSTTEYSVSLSQSVKLAKGKYKLSLIYEGDNDVDAGLTVKVTKETETLLNDTLGKTKGWDSWVEYKTTDDKAFEILADDTTVKVSIEGTFANKWCGFDDVVLWKGTESSVYTVDGLEKLIATIPADIDLYTSDSVNTLNEKKQSAIAITKKESPNESDIKASYDELKAAIVGLKFDSTKLTALITEAEALTESQYTAQSYQNLGITLADVKAVDTSTATNDELIAAYKALAKAISDLVFLSDIYVQKIDGITQDSIRGMDVSSYISIMDSFKEMNDGITKEEDKYGFRDYDGKLLDEQGFFNLLASQGVNYIRVRVWNDPYQTDEVSETKYGYGGGNNDLEKAIKIGQYATKAGMKVLVDFHYSDFWADPGKQMEPKAWAGKTVDEKAKLIKDYTKESLNQLIDAEVDVAMVQIGNETNGGMCGVFGTTKKVTVDGQEKTVDDWSDLDKLFDAGCDAVHEVAEAKSRTILAAVHFTNPESAGKQEGYAENLAAYNENNDGTPEGVSYDVFATSYYPYWHGSLSNLSSVLSVIAETYGKDVMVAETSYANTMTDYDGHENTVREGNNDTADDCIWSFTEQGQAKEFRDVLNTVLQIKKTDSNGDIHKGLGVFYWEGAWINLYDVSKYEGMQKEEYIDFNMDLWEKYGSGWASSYAVEYDPKDVGEWYGGSAVDNQAFFKADGSPRSSLKVFSFDNLSNGANTANLVFESYSIDSLTIEVGDTITADDLPACTVTYNDGTVVSDVVVSWESDASKQAIADVNTKAASADGRGIYNVPGIISVDNNGERVNENVNCKIVVEPQNIMINGSFENETAAPWKYTDGSENSIIGSGSGEGFPSTNDPRTGSKSLHFYNTEAFEFEVYNDVTIDTPGYYAAEMYLQGGGSTADKPESIKLIATVGDSTKYESDNAYLNGWKSWNKMEIANIKITRRMIDEGNNTVRVSLVAKNMPAKVWGTADDAKLFFEKALSDDELKAYEVEKLIAKLSSPVTLDSKADINAAETAYNKLSASAKALVGNAAILTNAKKELEILEKADSVDKLIAAIGTVSLDSKAVIEAARKAYDGLTQDSKNRVTKLDVLKAAESDFAKLEKNYNEVEQPADNVDKLIEAIGTVTLDSKAAITQARTAYDALSDGAKAKVTKLALLKTAEEELSKLEEAEAAKKATEEKVAAESVGAVVESTSTDTKYNITTSPATEGSTATVEFAGTNDNTEAVVTIQNTVKDAYGVEYVVTKIADNAFNSSKVLTDVTIGANVTEIGQNAFKNCTKLSNVIIQSDTIAKIDADAFSGAKALKSIDLSECKLEVIDKNAFSGCKKLSNIKINGNKLTKVGKNAFKNVKKNAKITIYAKNKKTYKKIVKLIKKSGAKNVKYAYKKKK